MTTPPAPPPGIYFDTAFPDYLRWPVPGQTTLKAMGASPAHYKARIDGLADLVPTDDMILGSALHTACLEPEMLLDRVVCWDVENSGGKAKRRYGAEWDAFCAEHAGKYILTRGMHGGLVAMVRALRRAPFMREWAGKWEGVEVAVVGDVCGLTMKARADALSPDPIVDLKKVRSCDPGIMARSIIDFGYHVQAWIYRHLFGRERFVLLCVEATEPYDIVPYELSPAFIRAGEEQAKRLIEKVLKCQESGVWPGRSDEPVLLEPPDWLASGESITLGGGRVYGGDDDDPFATLEA